jgi:hypothetical protein
VIHDADKAHESATNEQYESEQSEDDSTGEDETDDRMNDEEGYGMNEQEHLQDFDWFEPVYGKITLASTSTSNITEICHVHGELIRRRRIGHVFYGKMEEPTETTFNLAFDLFDRYGRLREFKTHGVKKGCTFRRWN